MKERIANRLRKLFVETLFRYYSTPYVITGKVGVEEMLDVWTQVQRRFYNAPPYFSNKMVRTSFPSPPWIYYWFSQLERVAKIQPVSNYSEVIR
mmetsp:Transcript_15678/g.11404  ORF Transcript_15678/g.11404 Transcript_15678/m.11404 type:complete len:94 (-) Transcript_15678:2935-3216(-)